MRIEITAEDIQNGEKRNPRRCAIARGLNRATGLKWEVWSGDWEAVECRTEGSCIVHECTIDLPAEAVEFADAFDCGEPVEPFSFEARTREVIG